MLVWLIQLATFEKALTPLKILLTNDDSHDSPLFLIAIELLKPLGELTVVVPAQEQSWKGKSMTRYGPLYVEKIDLHGTPAFAVTGTPADCVNMAIYNLMDSPPDIVVSGVNLGINTGLGFLLASGTLGACFEGNIAGLPALALSQEITYQDHQKWDQDRCFDETTVAELRKVLTVSFDEIWQQLVLAQPAHSLTWSVNLPRTLKQQGLVHTRLGQTYYKRCFARHGDQYRHELEPFATDKTADSDAAVVRSGRVSAARIDMSILGQKI
jgi:5'/3'-nucleotidase